MISASATAAIANDNIDKLSGALSAVNSAGRNMNADQIDKVSKDFESMFISQMLDGMFGDTEGAEAFGDSQTNDVYRGMMMDEYGKQITRAGGIGIADYVKRELLKEQEIKS